MYSANWKILESARVDRYIWGRDYKSPIIGYQEPYVQDITSERPAEYLSIRTSNADTVGYCNGVPLHIIPYYTISYVNQTGETYFLTMGQDGTLKLEFLNETQRTRLNDYKNNPDYRPDMKFCFPYHMRVYNSIIYQTNDKDDKYYNYKNVFIQSRIGKSNPKPGLVKVEGNSGELAGTMMPDLYSINYMLPIGEGAGKINATTFVFGDDATSDEVWIRLQNVPEPRSYFGYLRNAARAENDDYFVIKTPTPTKDGIEYAQVRYKEDVKTSFGSIDAAELEFVFIDSALLPGYDPKRIWYYQIKNKDGKFLTSAGFNPDDSNKPEDKYIYNNQGYAYFTDSIDNDTRYQQLFGLKYIRPADTSKPDPFAFWVVAGVDPKLANSRNSEYYYLSDDNTFGTFRYGGGTSKQEAETNAMNFIFGKVDNSGNFTDIPNVDGSEVEIFGVEANVKVTNAEGIIELYTVDGRLIKSVQATGASQLISAPKGVVIVKIGSKVVKVVVK